MDQRNEISKRYIRMYKDAAKIDKIEKNWKYSNDASFPVFLFGFVLLLYRKFKEGEIYG